MAQSKYIFFIQKKKEETCYFQMRRSKSYPVLHIPNPNQVK